jgi:hypothetical protein
MHSDLRATLVVEIQLQQLDRMSSDVAVVSSVIRGEEVDDFFRRHKIDDAVIAMLTSSQTENHLSTLSALRTSMHLS